MICLEVEVGEVFSEGDKFEVTVWGSISLRSLVNVEQEGNGMVFVGVVGWDAVDKPENADTVEE